MNYKFFSERRNEVGNAKGQTKANKDTPKSLLPFGHDFEGEIKKTNNLIRKQNSKEQWATLFLWETKCFTPTAIFYILSKTKNTKKQYDNCLGQGWSENRHQHLRQGAHVKTKPIHKGKSNKYKKLVLGK